MVVDGTASGHSGTVRPALSRAIRSVEAPGARLLLKALKRPCPDAYTRQEGGTRVCAPPALARHMPASH
jgi:hypothetical protein